MVRVRDGQRDHMTTTIVFWRVTAAARVAESKRTRVGEVALVPGDEDNGIARPGPGIHDRAHCFLEERITRCDQALHVGEVAGIGSRIRWSKDINKKIVASTPGAPKYNLESAAGFVFADAGSNPFRC